MKRDFVVGLDKLEFATIVNGVVQNNWLRIENIEAGSVVITSNKDQQTSITPEDKTLAELILYTPGDADVLTFAALEFSPANLQTFFNVIYDPATSKTIFLAKKKYANLAIRVYTSPIEGFIHRFTYLNTSCLPTFKNNLQKATTMATNVDASLLPYKDALSGKDAIGFHELLHEDETVVDSTPPTVNPPADSTANSATKSLVATGSAASPKTISDIQWSQVSGPNSAGFSAPKALTTNATGLITGVYVFKITITDSEGIQTSGQVTITATVS